MSRSSAASIRARVQEQPAPFPWMISKTSFLELQEKPASQFSDADIDRLIDLHLQRNALGVYGSLIGRGAPETRETLGRAFAISKSKLSEYGYLARDGSATRKGIRKAIEKLHDDEAWDKYVAYETLLKSFRKGERRSSKPRTEFQRRLARQQLGRFREQEFGTEPPLSPQAMAKQILVQAGFAAPQPAKKQKPKKPTAKSVASQRKGLGPQEMAAKLKALMGRR